MMALVIPMPRSATPARCCDLRDPRQISAVCLLYHVIERPPKTGTDTNNRQPTPPNVSPAISQMQRNTLNSSSLKHQGASSSNSTSIPLHRNSSSTPESLPTALPADDCSHPARCCVSCYHRNPRDFSFGSPPHPTKLICHLFESNSYRWPTTNLTTRERRLSMSLQI